MKTLARSWRSLVVPVLVLAMSAMAGAGYVALNRAAEANRVALLTVSTLRLDIAGLQDAVFASDPAAGNTVAQGRARVIRREAAIRADLLVLQRGPGGLAAGPAFARNVAGTFRATDALFTIGSGVGFPRSPRTPGLVAMLEGLRAANARTLDTAAKAYEHTQATRRRQANVLGLATLLLALAAFLFFYRRASVALAQATALADDNERLWRASHDDAVTDELTGLGNRRALYLEWERCAQDAEADDDLLLAMFDLDGFKQYNDTFGHGPGDDLLARLGEALAVTMRDNGTAFRMGGDEFCIVSRLGTFDGAALAQAASEALSETGEGWSIGCSYGVVWVASQETSLEEALRTADQRMYANKASRSTAGTQTAAALVQVLAEQGDGLGDHATAVAELSVATAEMLGMAPHDVHNVGLAAELHDVGKSAVPAAILNKPGSLTDAEWAFIRRHTIIGERIILAAPALAQVASIVRSSHERVDGAGYPDGLAGEEIPRTARIVAVADAFHAMVSERPYGRAVSRAEALAELERCAGSQFDAEVVQAFVKVELQRRGLGTGTAAAR